MRIDRTDKPPAAVVFEGDRPLLRGSLPDALRAAILQGLSDAPALFATVLGLRAPKRPYERVEVTLTSGSDTQGEAVSLGPGVLRLVVGERTTPDDAARIARHE